MPQTSDAVQATIDKWFPRQEDERFSQDYQVLKVLLSKGWTEGAGMLHPPTPSYWGPREDYVLLKYLVEEWDYDCITAPLIPDLK